MPVYSLLPIKPGEYHVLVGRKPIGRINYLGGSMMWAWKTYDKAGVDSFGKTATEFDAYQAAVDRHKALKAGPNARLGCLCAGIVCVPAWIFVVTAIVRWIR